MARSSSIDIADVENAVAILKLKKQDITAYKIRQIIGYGSYKKIEEYLEILQRQDIHEPENLAKYLHNLVEPVAQQLLKDFSEPFDKEREQLQSVINQLTENVRDLKKEIRNRDIALGDLQERFDNHKAESNQQIQMLTEANEKDQLTIKKLNTQNAEKTKQINDLKATHKETVATMKKEKKDLIAAHKSHVNDLKIQIRSKPKTNPKRASKKT